MSDFREIFNIIENEKKKWMDEHKEEKIREMVREAFDATNMNTILKICGFELGTRWPTKGQSKTYWRIDHCNNRSGNSPIGNLIKDAIGPELKRYMSGFDQLTIKDINELKKVANDEYLSQYKYTLKKEAKVLAEKHAKEFIKKQIDNALADDAEKIRLLMMDSNK